jgi:hypothetical protein
MRLYSRKKSTKNNLKRNRVFKYEDREREQTKSLTKA